MLRNFPIRRWLPTACLTVVALASVLWLQRVQESAANRNTETSKHDPDFYLEDFVQTSMDLDGTRKHELSGERLVHFPDTDTHELTKPYLKVFRPGLTPWHIESERGWVSATGEVVLLMGKVHAWRDDQLGGRELDMRTRDLRILTQTDYAETDQPVVIRNRHGESRGIGMRAFMADERIELLARVTTIHRRVAAPIQLPTSEP